MQTFLPFHSFGYSAKILDYRRLGKQRVEALQLLNALSGKSKGWINHPAAKMWRGCEGYLAMYGVYMCEEWKRRGYNDSCTNKLIVYIDQYPDSEYPWWLGHPDFHASHRSNLLRKDPAYYGKFNWQEPNDLPYFWPEPKQQTS